MRIKKDVVLTDGDDDHTDDNTTLRKYYYTGSAVLFVADSSNNKLLENILMPNGTTLMSARYEQEEEGNPINGYYTFNTDIRGSVTNILNNTGTLTTGYVYDEYGNQIKTGEQDFLNEATYTGAIYDDESELYYMNARYYSASTGQFTSRDTYLGNISNPATHNLYTYTGNNPINYIDPTGHNYVILAGILLGGVINVASQFIYDVGVSMENGQWTPSPWQDYVGSFVGGMAGGATFILAKGNMPATSAATAGVTSLTSDLLKYCTGYYEKNNLEKPTIYDITYKALGNTILGFGIGYIPLPPIGANYINSLENKALVLLEKRVQDILSRGAKSAITSSECLEMGGYLFLQSFYWLTNAVYDIAPASSIAIVPHTQNSNNTPNQTTPSGNNNAGNSNSGGGGSSDPIWGVDPYWYNYIL